MPLFRRALAGPVACVSGLLLGQSASADVIETVYNDANGITYHVLTANSWTESQAEAESLGGNLATVRSQAEQDWITATFGSYGDLWIGLADFAQEGVWVWASGEPVTYTNWGYGEPNGGTRENWAQVKPNSLWNDNSNVPAYATHGVVEVLSIPLVQAVQPERGHYHGGSLILVTGVGFQAGANPEVLLAGVLATDVTILDDMNLLCTTPAVPAGSGRVDVIVRHSQGEGVLEEGFTYTPALILSGDHTPGGTVELEYQFDVGDSLFAIYGFPPKVDLETPGYDGRLGILPFRTILLVTNWPFDNWTQTINLPNDPAIIGAEVLIQGLAGPSFGPPKDAAWTNCGLLSIQ